MEFTIFPRVSRAELWACRGGGPRREVAGQGFTPGFKQTWGSKVLTDLAITIPVKDRLSLTVGGLNVFDEFPDEWDPVNAFPFPQLGFVYGWETLPFGINGGYYYARLNFRVKH